MVQESPHLLGSGFMKKRVVLPLAPVGGEGFQHVRMGWGTMELVRPVSGAAICSAGGLFFVR